MGAGQFYIYLCVLSAIGVGFVFAIGAGLVYWGRRQERLKRDARRAARDAPDGADDGGGAAP